MAVAALIRGTTPTHLWGLDSATRITRQLHTLGITTVVHDPLDLHTHDDVLIVDADYLFEVRTFAGLLRHRGACLETQGDDAIAAAFVPAGELEAWLGALDTGNCPPQAERVNPAGLEAYDEQLRKVEPPLLVRIEADNRRALESLLYGNAYKGITDLVTKWWWPRPARVVVGWCANAGITPNMVTALGLLLVVAATVAFAAGYFMLGLACGWIMTLLDTVDGKLARVTVSSSRIGHILDHGMDIIHPPFWYVYWTLGLELEGTLGGYTGAELCIAMVAGYIAGRLLEALFHALGECSMFAWRPFDAWFRLITARRNPCLIILTALTLVGRPDVALLGVALWTVLSSAIMAVRLVYATAVRLRGEPLSSWLKDPDTAARDHARAFRMFSGTRRAYD